jgi:pyruvate formate lyase activating enzyme
MVRIVNASTPETSNPRGIVFDLQRASLHDGPGVRTTVFLKGCALRCAWCHNPESRRLRPQLGYDAAKCLGCRACVEACEHGIHSFDATDMHRLNWSQCRATGNCVPTCQGDALRLYGRMMSVAEVMAEVVKDRGYYETSSGGLTLSGGEPTTQLEFCTALLRAAKNAGLHTCLETCGISPRAAYEAVLPHTGLFFTTTRQPAKARTAR